MGFIQKIKGQSSSQLKSALAAMKSSPNNYTVQTDSLKAIDNFIITGGDSARSSAIKHGALPLVLNALRTHPTVVTVQIEGFKTLADLLDNNNNNWSSLQRTVSPAPGGAPSGGLTSSPSPGLAGDAGGSSNSNGFDGLTSSGKGNDFSYLNVSGGSSGLTGNLNAMLSEYDIVRLILNDMEIETMEVVLSVCRAVYVLADRLGQPFIGALTAAAAASSSCGCNFFHKVYIIMQKHIQDVYVQHNCTLIYCSLLHNRTDINVAPQFATVAAGGGGAAASSSDMTGRTGFVHDVLAFTINSLRKFKGYPDFIKDGLRLVGLILDSYFPSVVSVDEVISQDNLVVAVFDAMLENAVGGGSSGGGDGGDIVGNVGGVGVGSDKEAVVEEGLALVHKLLGQTCPVGGTTPLQAVVDNDAVGLLLTLARAGSVSARRGLFVNYSEVFTTVLNANNRLLEDRILTSPGESTDDAMRAAFTAIRGALDSPQVVGAALDLVNALFVAAHSPHLRIQLLTYILFNGELGFMCHTLLKAFFSASDIMFKLLQALYNIFGATESPPPDLAEAAAREKVVPAITSIMKEYTTSFGLQTKAMRTIVRVLDAAYVNRGGTTVPLEKDTYQTLSTTLENFENSPDVCGCYASVLARFARFGEANRAMLIKERFVKKIINVIKVFPDNVFIASSCCEALSILSEYPVFYNSGSSSSSSTNNAHGAGSLSSALSSSSSSSYANINDGSGGTSIVDIVVTIIRVNKTSPNILAPAFAALSTISTNSTSLLEAVACEDVVPMAVSLLKAPNPNADLIQSIVSFISVISQAKKDAAAKLYADQEFVTALLRAIASDPASNTALNGCAVLSSMCPDSDHADSLARAGAISVVCDVIQASANVAPPEMNVMRAAFKTLSVLAAGKDAAAAALAEAGRIEGLIGVINKNAAAASLSELSFVTLAVIAEASKANGEAIGRCGGVRTIVCGMAEHGSMGDVSANGCHALGALASQEDGPSSNREIIGKEGGISAVVSAMVEFRDNEVVQRYGCAALGNIGFRNAGNAELIAQMGGATAIFVSLRDNAENTTIQAAGCKALGMIADGNPAAAEAVGGDASDIIIEALRTSAAAPTLQEAAIYALYALANSSESVCSHIVATKPETTEVVASAAKALPQNTVVQEHACSILSLLGKATNNMAQQQQQQQAQQQQQQPQQPQQQQHHQQQQQQYKMMMNQQSQQFQMNSMQSIQMNSASRGSNGFESASLDILMDSLKKSSDNPAAIQSTLKVMYNALKRMKIPNNNGVSDVFVAKSGIQVLVQLIIVNSSSAPIKEYAFSVLSVLCENSAAASELARVLLGNNLLSLLLESMGPAAARSPVTQRAVCNITGSLARFHPWTEALESSGVPELVAASVVQILVAYSAMRPMVKTSLLSMSAMSSASQKLAVAITTAGGVGASLNILTALAPADPVADPASAALEEFACVFLGNICLKDPCAVQALEDAGGIGTVVSLVQKHAAACTDPAFLGLIKSILYLVAVLGSKTFEGARTVFFESGVVMPLILNTLRMAASDSYPVQAFQPLVKSAAIALANMSLSRKVLDSLDPVSVPAVILALLGKQLHPQTAMELIRALSKIAASQPIADALIASGAIATLYGIIKANSTGGSGGSSGGPGIIQYAVLTLGTIVVNCTKNGGTDDGDSDDDDDDSDDDGSSSSSESNNGIALLGNTGGGHPAGKPLFGEGLVKTLIGVLQSSRHPMVVDNTIYALSRDFLHDKQDRAVMESTGNFTKIIFDKISAYPQNEALKRSGFESLGCFCSVSNGDARFSADFLTIGGIKFLLGQLTAFQGSASVCEACLKLLDTLTGQRQGPWGESCAADAAVHFLYNEHGLAVISGLAKMYAQQRLVQLYCCSLLEKIEGVAASSLPESAQESLFGLVFLAMKTHYLDASVQHAGCLFIERVSGYGSSSGTLCAQMIRRGALTILFDTLQRHTSKAVQVSGMRALAGVAAAAWRDPSCASLALSLWSSGMKLVLKAMRMHPHQAAVQEAACLFLGNMAAASDHSAAAFLADGGLPTLLAVIDNFTPRRRRPLVLRNACYALASLAKAAPESTVTAAAAEGRDVVARCLLPAMDACQGYEALQRYAIAAITRLVSAQQADPGTAELAVQAVLRALTVFGRLSAPLFCEACAALTALVNGSQKNALLFIRSGGLDLVLTRLADPAPAVALSTARLLAPIYALASAGLVDPSEARVAQSFPTLIAVLAAAAPGPDKRKAFRCITRCFAAAPLVPDLTTDLVCNALPACPNTEDVPALEFWKTVLVALVFLTSKNTANCDALLLSPAASSALRDTALALFTPPPEGYVEPPAAALEYLALILGNVAAYASQSTRVNGTLTSFVVLVEPIAAARERMRLNNDIINYALNKLGTINN